MTIQELIDEVPPRRTLGRWLRLCTLLAADSLVVAGLWVAATHAVTPAAGLLHVPQWPVAMLAGIGAGAGGMLLVVRLHRRSAPAHVAGRVLAPA